MQSSNSERNLLRTPETHSEDEFVNHGEIATETDPLPTSDNIILVTPPALDIFVFTPPPLHQNEETGTTDIEPVVLLELYDLTRDSIVQDIVSTAGTVSYNAMMEKLEGELTEAARLGKEMTKLASKVKQTGDWLKINYAKALEDAKNDERKRKRRRHGFSEVRALHRDEELPMGVRMRMRK